MRLFGRSCVVAAMLVGGLVALAAPAAAQTDDEPATDELVVLTGRLVVPEGETVRTAVIFNGPAVIDGTVTESLVVFNGRTEISGTVEQDVIVFNGDLVLRSGARVGGDVASLEEPEIEQGATVGGSVEDISKRWDVYDATFIGRFAWWLGYTVSTLILGLVLLLFASRLDVASVRALRERTGGTIGFGLLVFFVLPIVVVLLLVTIVGIPLGLFLLFALGLVYTIAYVVGTLALGRLVIKEPKTRWLAFFVGWGVFRLLALVPFLGGLAWTVAAVVGFGALWVAARIARGEARPMAPEVAAPPPPPLPTS
jgi:hypothetical protein